MSIRRTWRYANIGILCLLFLFPFPVKVPTARPTTHVTSITMVREYAEVVPLAISPHGH